MVGGGGGVGKFLPHQTNVWKFGKNREIRPIFLRTFPQSALFSMNFFFYKFKLVLL